MKKAILILAAISLLICGNINGQNMADLFEKVDKSVVVIKVIDLSNTGTGDPYSQVAYGSLGSGVLIDTYGTILTAAHVVRTASEIMVEFKDGQQLKARVIKSAAEADVALIKTNKAPKNLFPAKVGDSDKMRIGDRIFVIGSPMGLYHSLSVGHISGRHTEEFTMSKIKRIEFFQTDAAINTGNSGGPMFNLDGEVVGIVSSIISRSGGFEGLGFAATSNIAMQITSAEGNNWFGLDAIFLSETLAKIFNVPQKGGFLVKSVAEKSPGYFMGLKGGYLNIEIEGQTILAGGDIIMAINEHRFDSEMAFEKFIEYYQTLKKGSRIKAEVLRSGKIKKLEWVIP